MLILIILVIYRSPHFESCLFETRAHWPVQAGAVRQADPGAGFREAEVGREALVDRLVAKRTAEALAKAEAEAAKAAAENGGKDGFALRQEVLQGAEVICAQVRACAHLCFHSL